MKRLYNSWLIAIFTCFTIIQITAQTISGVVKSNADGQPLVGANVSVKGTTVGTVTDIDGAFTLSAKPTDVLTFTYIGFSTIDVAINGRAMVEVSMSEDAKTLQEVIVTGYGTQIKRDLTGNIAKIKASEFKDAPVNSLESVIQGRAAGVQVNAGNGKLGQAMQIRIRGNSSVSASNEPLYIVDGIPITTANLSNIGGATNSIVDINPQDIESIEILKDASAAAIYGSRASNGVVLITTKKGKEGRTNVNFGIQYGNSKPTRKVDFLNSAQFIDYYRKAAINADRLDGIDPSDPGSSLSYMESYFEATSLGTFGTPNQADTKWDDLAFQDAPQKQIDLSIDGGNAKTKFYVSGQFFDQSGIMVGNQLGRMSGRINLEHEASKIFKLGFNLGLARTLNERLSGDRQFDNPLQIVALTPLSPLNDPATGLLIGSPPGDINQPLYFNPLLNIGNSYFNTTVHRNLSNVYGAINILPGLSFRAELGVDFLNQQEESYDNSITQRNTSFAFGTGSNRFTRVENLNTNNYFNYVKSFRASDLSVTAGMSYQESKQVFNSVTGTDYPSDAYQKIASAAKITAGNSTETNFRFVSYFARANYKLSDKYLLGLSTRIDGSSRFGSDSRYGFFPAISAGWILSEENFLQESNLFSFLKLRASYGRTGNAEIGNFPQLGLYSGDAGYGNEPGQRPSQLGNPDLKWETTDQLDLGIDFGLFHDRINGEIDVYQKKTTGLLLNVNVPASTGFATVTKNVGKLENNGVELAINGTVINGADFKWNLGFNIGINRNEITDLQGQIIEGGLNSMSRAVEGQPLSTFFLQEYAGVDPANGNALWYKNAKNTDGTIDRSTTSTYSQAQRVVIGNALPKWIGGLNSSFSFKGIELSMLWNTVQGNLVNFYGAGRFSSANGRFEDNQTVDQLDSWTPENTITNTPEARLFYNNGAQVSSRFIQDGSFIRLRTATLSYDLPKSILRNVRINSARVFVTGLNLLTITDYTGWDPEVNSDDVVTNIAQGYDFYSPPLPRTIMAGINLKF